MFDKQSRLTNKSDYDIEIEKLYFMRMKLYNILSEDLRKTKSDDDKEKLINQYRKQIYTIDNTIRLLNSKINSKNNAQT